MISTKKLLSVVAILSLVFSPVTPAFAADVWWTNVGSGSWETGTNWSGNAVPNAGQSVDIDEEAGGVALTVTVNDVRAVGSLTVGGQSSKNLVIANGAGLSVQDLGGNGGFSSTSSGSLTINGSGYLLMNESTYLTGDVLVNNGTGVGASSGIVISTKSSGTSVTAKISGTGNMYVYGGETCTISGNTSYTGITYVGGATTLKISDGGDIDSTSSADVDGTLQFDYSGNHTFTSSITGDGGITKTGAGTLTLSTNTSSYAGATTVSEGTLKLDDIDLNDLTAISIASGATFEISESHNPVIWNNTMSGEGNFTKSGVGLIYFQTAKTYTGDTNITAGTLRMDNSNLLSNSTDVVVTGGATYDLNNNSDTVSSISGAGDITLGSGTLTVGNASNQTFSGAISETGALVKQGAGTLTFSGTNTYSGSTTISDGTLQIGSGGGTGKLNATGGIVNNAALSINRTGTVTQSMDLGVISGGGTVTTTGSATVILDQTNTYTGATTISAGTLQIGAGAGTGILNATGGIVDNATLVINRNNTVTQSADLGTISGLGIVTQAGTGTTIFDIANTYLGATNITAGVLNIRNSTAISTSSGTFVTSGAALQMQGGITVAGEAITLNGTGVSTDGALRNISGSNSWTTGVIALGSDSRINSDVGSTLTLGSGGITGAHNLTIGGAGATTVTGVIGTGAGILTKTDAGTLILSGANTYSGATTISGGTLQIGAGLGTGTLNPAGGIVDNVALVINRNNTVTQSADLGTISGLGIVTQAGTGTTIFDIANTYTGGTTISAGTLQAGNAQALGNTGNVINNSILDVGIYDVGNSSRVGTYTQGAAASFNTTVRSAVNNDSGKLMTTGAVSTSPAVGSIVNMSVDDFLYVPTGATYTIIDTTGGVVSNVPGKINTTDGNRHVLFNGSVASGNLVMTGDRSANGYAADAEGNPNAANVGHTLDNVLSPSADMTTVLNNLEGQSQADTVTSMSTMMPDVSSGVAEGSRAMTGNSFTMISNRLGGARNVGDGSGVSAGEMMNGVGVWMQGLGNHMKQDERKGIQGFSANTWGTTIGADKVLDDHFRAGLAGSYGWAGVHSKQPGSPSDNINSYQATIYGSYDSLDLNKARQSGKRSYEAVRSQVEDSWYVDGMAAFTQNNYDSRREVWVAGLPKRISKADHYGQQYSTNFEAGYKFVFEETKNLEVTPFAGLGYNYLYMNSYKEKGADSLNLNVRGEGYNQLEQSLGTKLAYPIVAKKVGTFIPSAKAAWLYDYIGDRFETTASFAGGGASFNTTGAKPAKNGMLFGAELAFLNKGNMTVTGNWDIELKDQFISNTYYGTVRYDF